MMSRTLSFQNGSVDSLGDLAKCVLTPEGLCPRGTVPAEIPSSPPMLRVRESVVLADLSRRARLAN